MAGNTYGTPVDSNVYLTAVNNNSFAVLNQINGEPMNNILDYLKAKSSLTDVIDASFTNNINLFAEAGKSTPPNILKRVFGASSKPGEPAGVFNNIATKELKQDSVIFRVIVLYIRVKYLMNKLTTLTATEVEKKSLIEKLAINIYLITANLDAYQEEVNPSSGGKKRKQKGGMDTAKIYNAQGLVQELSALNQNDTPSPALLFPSPFSASSLTASSGATDTLPPATVAALMPAIPTPQIGGKKKVKSARKNKH